MRVSNVVFSADMDTCAATLPPTRDGFAFKTRLAYGNEHGLTVRLTSKRDRCHHVFRGLLGVGVVLPCRVIHSPVQRSRTDDHCGKHRIFEHMHRSSLHLDTTPRNLHVARFLQVFAASPRYFGVQGMRRAYHATVASSSFSILFCLRYVYHVTATGSLGVILSATHSQTTNQ